MNELQPNFNVGDRVIVTQPYTGSLKAAPVGSVGTVLEKSQAPWVLFDHDVGTPYHPNAITVPNLPPSYIGRLDCVNKFRLGSYKPNPIWLRIKEQVKQFLRGM